MKVLHLLHSLNPGGIERWVLQILKAVSRVDCEMDVCCKGFHRGRWADQAQDLGAKVLLNPLTPEHIVFGVRLSSMLKYYDVLHIHIGIYGGFPAWVAHRVNVKVITTFHNVKFPPETWLFNLPVLEYSRSVYAKWSLAYSIKESDFLVGVSQACLDSFVPNVEKFRLKSCVIPHGVKIFLAKTKQSSDLFRANLGWPAHSRLVINVGRFSLQKNHHTVLKVFKMVSARLQEARLVLVGDGPLRSEIEQAARELHLGDKVAFLGFRDDAAEIMTFCDLMLMPSLFEGFGITAIEASAAGIPVIGGRVPGLVEAISDGQTGLLFEPQDSGGMADAIVRLLSDTDFAKKMGEAGRQRVQEHFSIESMASRYLALYRHCMENTDHKRC